MDNNYNDYNFNRNESEGNEERRENYYGTYSTENYRSVESEERREKISGRKKGVGKVIALTLAAVLLVGSSVGGGVYIGRKLTLEETKKVKTELTLSEEAGEGEQVEVSEVKNKLSIATTGDTMDQVIATPTDVSGVVENVMPAIVSISNVYDVTENFWGQRYSNRNGGEGSGIIIGQNKDEILIVTNNHVSKVEKGASNQKITVTFNDEKTAEATVKGADAGSDLAVISVKVKDIEKDTLSHIKIASLGDSTKAKVGQMVVAIGNALGYGQSTTVGYISALEREVVTEDYTMKLLQTDAAINQGNSGGALLNTKGEVIGINSVKYAGSKIEGMGFAIPISTAVPIIHDLMNREIISEDEQSYLGIMGQDVTSKLNQIYGIPVGIYVAKVTKNSPASKAGLKMGDIIIGFNNYKIKTMVELQEKLATVKAGKVVEITIKEYSDGDYKERKIPVTLGNRSEIKEEDFRNKKKEERRRRPERRERDEFFEEEDPFDFFFNR